VRIQKLTRSQLYRVLLVLPLGAAVLFTSAAAEPGAKDMSLSWEVRGLDMAVFGAGKPTEPNRRIENGFHDALVLVIVMLMHVNSTSRITTTQKRRSFITTL
jgi:hypothetical protein